MAAEFRPVFIGRPVEGAKARKRLGHGFTVWASADSWRRLYDALVWLSRGDVERLRGFLVVDSVDRRAASAVDVLTVARGKLGVMQ